MELLTFISSSFIAYFIDSIYFSSCSKAFIFYSFYRRDLYLSSELKQKLMQFTRENS